MLEIDNEKSIYVLADYGEKKVTLPATTPRDSAGVTIYETSDAEHRLTVHVVTATCADVMSGEEMTHTVHIVLDGKEYQGCGRLLRPR
jgi:putative lipoprotein